MYALDRKWRRLLGVPSPVSVPFGLADGLDRESRAENEFGDAPLGDKRLTRRLVASAAVQAEHPGSSFLAAAQGRGALVTGYYRMARERRQSGEHSGGASAAHAAGRGRTWRSASAATSTSRPVRVARASASKNRNSAGTLGLHMHPGGERRRLAARRPARMTRPPARPRRASRERKTQRWVRGLRDCSLPNSTARGWSR